jgi:tetratricopeptide (TPR) repeat protein
VLLRTSGRVLFDEAYLGVPGDQANSVNYLVNPSFEEDGGSENPLQWWKRNVHIPGISREKPQKMGLPVAYQNVSDLLNGKVGAITHRSDGLENCSLHPEMTSWLSGLNVRLEKSGGLAGMEGLYQLARKLAPKCPQPYAALAGLYELQHSYTKAAELYHRAAVLSGESGLAGKYSFSEGLLHLRQTGDYMAAVRAFALAEAIRGWERGAWYRGAASFYLGQALEALDRLPEAVDAYRRVLLCSSCSFYHAAAEERLIVLNRTTTQEQQP